MKNQLPRITIITPSFNQGKFIQDTIDSVLDQEYKNLEYIIIDGGSTDNTFEIVQKYSEHLTWISEPDGGQADAINKGIKKATGDIIAFLNSDDYYYPETLLKVAKTFNEHPDIVWLTGNYHIVSENKKIIQPYVVKYKDLYRKYSNPHLLRLTNYIAQPSTFWRKKVNEESGGFDSTLRYSFDYDFWLRMIDKYPHSYLNEPLSAFRIHDQSKGGVEYHSQFTEELSVLKKYPCSKFEYLFHLVHNWLIVKSYDMLKF